MPNKYSSAFFFTLFCLLSVVFSTPAGGKLPETSRLISSDTVLMINIPNFSEFKAQIEKTSLYGLYKDPLMAPFIENAKQKWNKKIAELDQNNFIKTLIDTDVLPQGRVSLVMIPDINKKDQNEAPLLLITEWGQENIAKVREAMNKLMEKNIEMGGRSKKSEEFQGVNIETVVDEEGSQISFCFIEDCFIAAVDIDVLKFAAAHAQGASSPTLADDAEFQNTLRATGPNHDLDFFLNLKQIMKLTALDNPTGQAQSTFTNLGLDNVSGLGASLAVARSPDSSCSAKMLLKINGSKRGLCRIFDAPSAVVEVPQFVPQSSYRVSVVNLSVKNMFTEVSSLLNSFNPMLAAFLYSNLTEPEPGGEPPLKLKEDIIDHLGSQIIVAQGIKKPFSNSLVPVEYAVAIAVTNRRALEKSLDTLHSQRIAPNNPQAKRELLGHTIYIVNLGFLPIFGRGTAAPMQDGESNQTALPSMPNFAFTVTDTHVIFGLESSVEQAVRTLRSAESINNAKWFNAAKSALSSDAIAAGFEDNRASMEYLWWMMKQAGTSEKLKSSPTMGMGPAAAMLTEAELDFSLLPEFDKIKKYFGIASSNMVSREDGFFAETKLLNAPADD